MSANARLALLLLGLAACSVTDAAPSPPAPIPMEGWRTVRGKPPTQAEFAALVATCQAQGGPLDSCLADMGLRRGQ